MIEWWYGPKISRSSLIKVVHPTTLAVAQVLTNPFYKTIDGKMIINRAGMIVDPTFEFHCPFKERVDQDTDKIHWFKGPDDQPDGRVIAVDAIRSDHFTTKRMTSEKMAVKKALERLGLATVVVVLARVHPTEVWDDFHCDAFRYFPNT